LIQVEQTEILFFYGLKKIVSSFSVLHSLAWFQRNQVKPRLEISFLAFFKSNPSEKCKKKFLHCLFISKRSMAGMLSQKELSVRAHGMDHPLDVGGLVGGDKLISSSADDKSECNKGIE